MVEIFNCPISCDHTFFTVLEVEIKRDKNDKSIGLYILTRIKIDKGYLDLD